MTQLGPGFLRRPPPLVQGPAQAHQARVDRWGRHARVERELARRENLWEYTYERG